MEVNVLIIRVCIVSQTQNVVQEMSDFSDIQDNYTYFCYFLATGMLYNWTSFLQLHSKVFKIVQCRANICLKTMQSVPSLASHFGIKF